MYYEEIFIINKITWGKENIWFGIKFLVGLNTWSILI